jgi:hypothetical protein
MADNMVFWTLNQASKETGKSKSQIHKALVDGKISYIEKSKSGYKLDPAEVCRVFQIEQTQNTQKEQYRTEKNSLENELLAQKIQFLEDKIDLLKNSLENSEQEKNRLFQIVERQTVLLEDMRQKSDKPKEAEPRKKFLGIF